MARRASLVWFVVVPGRGSPAMPSAAAPATPVVAVGYDGSVLSARALRWGADRVRQEDGDLLIVTAVAPPDARTSSPNHRPARLRSAQLRATAGARLARALLRDPERIRIAVHETSAGAALVQEAARADLLVVGTRSRTGPRSLVLGVTSGHCTRVSPVPVALVGFTGGDGPPARLVVVGDRGTEAGAAAVAWTAGRVRKLELPVLVVVATKPATPEWDRAAGSPRGAHRQAAERLEVLVDALRRASGGRRDVRGQVVDGQVADAVRRTTRATDLLVVGRRGDAELSAVVQAAWCPVVTVPGSFTPRRPRREGTQMGATT